MFDLLKQYFDAVLACFGQFVLINLACKSKGGFADTHVSINQIHIMQQIRLKPTRLIKTLTSLGSTW